MQGSDDSCYFIGIYLQWLDVIGGDLDTRFQATEKDIRESEYRAATGGCFAAMYWYIEPNLDKKSPSSIRDKVNTTYVWSAQEWKWLLEAAERGFKEAQITAARIYRNGATNAPPDTSKANFWHNKLVSNVPSGAPYPSCDNVGITPLP